MKLESNKFYMKQALLQAKLAFAKNEVPVGAVVVDKDGKILSRSYNKIEKQKCQVAHAEALAIKAACKKFGDWRLNGCTLYVTLEPCLMCLGLIQLSRIDKVVFGASSPLFGALASNGNARAQLQNGYIDKIRVDSGVCEVECAKLLQGFFVKQRKRKAST